MPHARCKPDDLFPTEDEIAERAFELCFVHREVGTITRSCLQLAEKELLDLAADRAVDAGGRDGDRDGDEAAT